MAQKGYENTMRLEPTEYSIIGEPNIAIVWTSSSHGFWYVWHCFKELYLSDGDWQYSAPTQFKTPEEALAAFEKTIS